MVTDDARRLLRVLVVDDHEVFAEMLSFALSAQPDISCVGIATSVADGLAAAVEIRPDILLLDIAIGDDNGLLAIPRFRKAVPGIQVAVLTAHRGSRWMVQSRQAGAAAFVPKECPLVDVIDVLRGLRGGGEMIIAPSARQDYVAVSATAHLLTRREHDVLQGLGRGQPPKVIARSLNISTETLRGYLRTLMTKLGTTSQLETVVVAQRLGLLGTPGDV